VLLQRVLHPSPPEPIVNFARSLKFRNTILVYLVVDRNPLFPDQWLYINDPRVKVGRVTNFANWSPHMLPNSHQTPLCCEYWCDFGDRLWNASDEQLRDRAERELRTIQLLGNESISSGFVLKLPRVYPVYSGNYKVALSKIQSYLQQFENLQLIGRYGSFKYNNQDHSLLMGILAAENIISPGAYDLWSVNSDSEYLEEIKRDRAPKYAPTTARFSQSASQ
jgi:protoporphyrinogen oxidase